MTDQLGQSQVIPYLKELTKNGYQFTILSFEKKERLEKSGPMIRALLEKAGIGWSTLTFTTRPPVFSKLFDQWKLNRTAAKLNKENKFDMVHCRSYVAAAAGLKLFRDSATPFLLDMRGFWVDERVDSGLWNLKNPLYRFFYKLYKKKERNYFSDSAHIISLTEKGRIELIDAYHVPPEKITVIPCCADMEHFDYKKIGQADKEKLRTKLAIAPGSRVLSYLGSLGGWYMTGEMLDFFAVVRTKLPVTIFLLITHDDKEKIISDAATRGIPAADLRIQPASRNEVPAYLSLSDWNVFFIKDLYSKRASSPTKQGEVMAMGIPVICNDIGDTGKIVRETDAGLVIDAFNRNEYEKICSALPGLAGKNKEMIRESARKYYDLEQGVRLYEQVYNKLLNQGKGIST